MHNDSILEVKFSAKADNVKLTEDVVIRTETLRFKGKMLQFPSPAAVRTANPAIDPFLQFIALEGLFKTTISLYAAYELEKVLERQTDRISIKIII
jgi:hypothetical protein